MTTTDLIGLKEREIKEFEELLYLKIKNKLHNIQDSEDKEQLIEDKINNNKRIGKLIDELIILGSEEMESGYNNRDNKY